MKIPVLHPPSGITLKFRWSKIDNIEILVGTIQKAFFCVTFQKTLFFVFPDRKYFFL
jgi:hypothetical protein